MGDVTTTRILDYFQAGRGLGLERSLTCDVYWELSISLSLLAGKKGWETRPECRNVWRIMDVSQHGKTTLRRVGRHAREFSRVRLYQDKLKFAMKMVRFDGNSAFRSRLRRLCCLGVILLPFFNPWLKTALISNQWHILLIQMTKLIPRSVWRSHQTASTQ